MIVYNGVESTLTYREKEMTQQPRGEWFSDEAFWIETYSFMFPPERFDDAVADIEKIIGLVQFTGTSVLDLCCGPGRFSVPLAKRGLAVTGVDQTEFLLDKARERAGSEQVTVEWIRADMREFRRPERFELALSLFTSFGYFDRKEEDIAVLKNIHASLKPGGTLVIDVAGKEILAKNYHSTNAHDLPDGSKIVECHQITDGWSRIRNEWIVLRKGQAKHFEFELTIYSGQELKDRLESVGFRDVNLYGNFDGDEYGLDAKRLIAVGRK